MKLSAELEERIKPFRDDIISENIVDIPSIKIHLPRFDFPKHAYEGMPKNNYLGIVILHNLADFNPIPDGQEQYMGKLEDFVSKDVLDNLGDNITHHLDPYVMKLNNLCHNLVKLRALASKHGFEATHGNLGFFATRYIGGSVVSMNVGISTFKAEAVKYAT